MSRFVFFLYLGSYLASGQEPIPDFLFREWRSVIQISHHVPATDTAYYRDYDHKAGIYSPPKVIESIIKRHPKGVVIILDEREYVFGRRLVLPSNVILKGSGIDKTKLIFMDSLETTAHVLMQGEKTNHKYLHKQMLTKGDSILQADSDFPWNAGDWVMLFSDDNHMSSDWANNKCTQVLQVKDRTEDGGIVFSSPYNRDYGISEAITFAGLNPVVNAAIMDLSIESKECKTGFVANIRMNMAVGCFVSNIRSDSCNYAHLAIEASAYCMINESRITNAHDYGNGGRGYGVVLQYGATNCQITENTLDRLRHSLLLQLSANGNVLLKNKSTNPYWTGVFLPKKSAGDIVFHGNFPFANLIAENNVGQIVLDDSHGANGPDNCFYANEVNSYGIFMSNKKAGSGQYFINNLVLRRGILKGRYKLRGENVEIENIVGKKLRPRNSKYTGRDLTPEKIR